MGTKTCTTTESALRLDPILQTVFVHMNLKDLKACRFVSSQWAGNALNIIRKKSLLRLTSEEKLAKFMALFETEGSQRQPSTASKFHGFPFEVCDWSDSISQNLRTLSPTELSVSLGTWLKSGPSSSTNPNLFQITPSALNSLLVQFSKSLVTLDLPEFAVPDSLSNFTLSFPNLNKLVICYNAHGEIFDLANSPKLSSLFLSIIKNSPKLQHLSVSWTKEHFWEQLVLLEPELKCLSTLQSLTLPVCNTTISQKICSLRNINIQKLSTQFLLGVSDHLIGRLAHSLEELNFFTPRESALSPINFIRMPKLTLLNAGSSQLSFPSINQDLLPNLKEVKATYWDWVWTFEQLPDEYHYWRTENPHTGVKTIDIRFPSVSEITGEYEVLENFEDFCVRILEKFPSLVNIRIRNLVFCHLPLKVKTAVEEFRERLKDLRVVDYDKEVPNPGHTDLFPNVACTEVEIWDLNPKEWLKVWSGDSKDQMDYGDVDIPNGHFLQLRILKLVWISRLKLADLIEKFPAIEQLEIVGGRCVDRFDKRRMMQSRPGLKFVQHPCVCPSEDSWYINDPDSHSVFCQLFEI